jgi:hypothetical protein
MPVIRAKVLLTNGLRKQDRLGYDKEWEADSSEDTLEVLDIETDSVLS